jgi:hypothetical protein
MGLEKQIAVNKDDYFRITDELRTVQIQAKNLEIDN